MTRFTLCILAILGTTACDPYDAESRNAPQVNTTNPPASVSHSGGVRISGAGRIGASGRW